MFREKNGFTLIELVITIAILVVLTSISVPIYQGHIKKARLAEGYALLSSIREAELMYRTERRNFYTRAGYWDSGKSFTCNDDVLGINARLNKYYTSFGVYSSLSNNFTYAFRATVTSRDGTMNLDYNLKGEAVFS